MSIIVVLALMTLAAVVIFAGYEQNKTLRRMADSDAPKSTLAADAPSTTPDGKGQP
jgi:hypothetical protein